MVSTKTVETEPPCNCRFYPSARDGDQRRCGQEGGPAPPQAEPAVGGREQSLAAKGGHPAGHGEGGDGKGRLVLSLRERAVGVCIRAGHQRQHKGESKSFCESGACLREGYLN